MNMRDAVTKLMPAFVKILKERFPNLTAEESVRLAGDLAEAVIKVTDEPKVGTVDLGTGEFTPDKP